MNSAIANTSMHPNKKDHVFNLVLVLAVTGVHDLVLLVFTASPRVLSIILKWISTLAQVGITVFKSWSSDVESLSDSDRLVFQTSGQEEICT